MKKIKSFLNKNVTWGGYIKLLAGCSIVGAIIIAIELLYLGYFSFIPEAFRKGKEKIKEFFID